MTIQEQCANRIYELLPELKEEIAHYQGEQAPAIEEIYHPIRLADILLAIETVINNRSNEDWIPKDLIFRDVTVKYNLSQDNVLNQSNELCKWALELLSDKN